MKPAASGASRFDLYEWCVQAPDLHARFLRALHGGRPKVLRDDFCGPASIARAWIGLGRGMRAVGLDRAPEPLSHARSRANLAGITGRRLRLLQCDAAIPSVRADIIAAFNFGIGEVHLREALLSYFRCAHDALFRGGIVVVDIYGGAGAFAPSRTTRRMRTPIGNVGYTWEQKRGDPLTGMVENQIHFRLPDGCSMRSAFEYRWRLWGVPEVRDAMLEAGFCSTEVHTDYGAAIDGEGNPVPRPGNGEEIGGRTFVAYIVGRR